MYVFARSTAAFCSVPYSHRDSGSSTAFSSSTVDAAPIASTLPRCSDASLGGGPGGGGTDDAGGGGAAGGPAGAAMPEGGAPNPAGASPKPAGASPKPCGASEKVAPGERSSPPTRVVGRSPSSSSARGSSIARRVNLEDDDDKRFRGGADRAFTNFTAPRLSPPALLSASRRARSERQSSHANGPSDPRRGGGGECSQERPHQRGPACLQPCASGYGL